MTPTSYIINSISPKTFADLEAAAQKAFAERDENNRLLATVPTGRGHIKARQAEARADFELDPKNKEKRRRFNEVMSETSDAFQKQERSAYKARRHRIDSDLVELVKRKAALVLPHGKKLVEKFEVPERKTADEIGVPYQPSSAVRALRDALGALHDLANLDAGANLSRDQIDAILR